MHELSVQGHRIPALGFGTWQLTGADCARAVETALETGYRHIDTAQIYENEAEVGQALSASALPRDRIFLTTKIWTDHLRDGALQKSAEESLRKLKTDYVDLLLIHWPVTDAPFAEQIAALRAVQDSGRARMIGVSNFTVAQMEEVVSGLKAPIVNNQVEYHPFLSQKPVLDFARRHGLFLTAYSPLARGRISGAPVIENLARQYGKTPGQISLRWLIQQDNVAAIPKAANTAHIRENFDIFDFALTDGDMAAIAALARADGRIVNPAWAPAWDKAA